MTVPKLSYTHVVQLALQMHSTYQQQAGFHKGMPSYKPNLSPLVTILFPNQESQGCLNISAAAYTDAI